MKTHLRLGLNNLTLIFQSEKDNSTSCNLHFTCDFDHACDDLSEDRDDTGTWIAIGCSAVAVIFVIGFLGLCGGFLG